MVRKSKPYKTYPKEFKLEALRLGMYGVRVYGVRSLIAGLIKA